MLLHPLEGSITFIAQDPCRAPRRRRPSGGGAAGVAGDKCEQLKNEINGYPSLAILDGNPSLLGWW